jgi:hypothetical protein
MKKVNEWLIWFTDAEETINRLNDFEVKLSDLTKDKLRQILKYSSFVGGLIPIKYGADIYFRAANEMIRLVEIETKVKFKKYKKCDYTLD